MHSRKLNLMRLQSRRELMLQLVHVDSQWKVASQYGQAYQTAIDGSRHVFFSAGAALLGSGTEALTEPLSRSVI